MKIYKIELDSDLGELWLDDEKQPIAYIHASDGNFRKEYYGFVFKALKAELVELYATDLLSDGEYDALFECDSKESFYDVLKEKL